MSYRIIVGLLFMIINIVYAQCDYSSESPCNLDNGCEWIATYQWYDCDNFSNSTQCNNYSEYGCYWDSHWYYSGWSDCDGPSFQLETGGFCQEIEMPDCSDLEEATCNHPLYGEGCEWVEDITQGNCYYAFSSYAECIANGCSWYNPGTYGYMGSHCYGGTYTIDNSYCEEIQYQLGDINGDSSINILDIIQTVEIILIGDYNYIVDMDSNDSINVLDIIILVEIIINT